MQTRSKKAEVRPYSSCSYVRAHPRAPARLFAPVPSRGCRLDAKVVSEIIGESLQSEEPFNLSTFQGHCVTNYN